MIKKIIKYISLLILISSMILAGIIYISSLGSYTEEDFNIPSDFFNTRHYDKDADSEDNWFKDYLKLLEVLDSYNKSELQYYDVQSKCIFFNWDKKNCDTLYLPLITEFNTEKLDSLLIDNRRLKKDISDDFILNTLNQYIWWINDNWDRKIEKILKNTYIEQIQKIKVSQNKNQKIEELINEIKPKSNRQFKNFIHINSIKLNKISKKDFFKIEDKYLWFDKDIVYHSSMFKYIHSSWYFAYIYMEKWDYKKWLNILIDNQDFLDKLLEKWDLDFYNSLAIISLNNINLTILEYLLNNYQLDDELLKSSLRSLDKSIEYWLLKNWFKMEFLDLYSEIWYKKYFEDFYETLSFYEKIKTSLFYSKWETSLLYKHYYYQIIKNIWDYNFLLENNINNYIWRKIINSNTTIYTTQFQKVKNLKTLRNKIIKQLKTD